MDGRYVGGGGIGGEWVEGGRSDRWEGCHTLCAVLTCWRGPFLLGEGRRRVQCAVQRSAVLYNPYLDSRSMPCPACLEGDRCRYTPGCPVPLRHTSPSPHPSPRSQPHPPSLSALSCITHPSPITHNHPSPIPIPIIHHSQPPIPHPSLQTRPPWSKAEGGLREAHGSTRNVRPPLIHPSLASLARRVCRRGGRGTMQYVPAAERRAPALA